ncbi:MAG: hypothetical protein JXQ91_09435 [Vannielia sp.]|uniref:acyl-CoA dehydrogenase family protein n=1 Tax=Vannielia sp. TaxID=2813045 RepID=UPI003B8B6C05
MSFSLDPTEDQTQILDAARTMLAEHYPTERLRDRPRRDDMGPLAAFGAFALALPEDSGFTLLEEALLHVALGRHLLSPASLAMPLAVRLAAETDRAELAGQIAGGEVCVAAALGSADGLLLLDGAEASLALRLDTTTPELLDLTGHERREAKAMGHHIPLHRCALPAPGPNATGSPQTALVAQVLIAAQLLGVAEGARDLAVDYAGTREQFGRPIGAFQAIKHRCANMKLATEMLSAQLDMAAISLRDAHEDAAFQCAALARLAPRLAMENARACVQIHGGIGFSAEADAQLFVKQAHILSRLCPAANMLAPAAPMAPTRKET